MFMKEYTINLLWDDKQFFLRQSFKDALHYMMAWCYSNYQQVKIWSEGTSRDFEALYSNADDPDHKYLIHAHYDATTDTYSFHS